MSKAVPEPPPNPERARSRAHTAPISPFPKGQSKLEEAAEEGGEQTGLEQHLDTK